MKSNIPADVISDMLVVCNAALQQPELQQNTASHLDAQVEDHSITALEKQQTGHSVELVFCALQGFAGKHFAVLSPFEVDQCFEPSLSS